MTDAPVTERPFALAANHADSRWPLGETRQNDYGPVEVDMRHLRAARSALAQHEQEKRE